MAMVSLHLCTLLVLLAFSTMASAVNITSPGCRSLYNCSQSSSISSSHATFVLINKTCILSQDCVISDMELVHLKADRNNQATIKIINGSSLVFENTSTLIIENVTFVACGTHKELNSSYGLSIINSVNVQLTNIAFSNSTAGVLHVSNCTVTIMNVMIANNQHEGTSLSSIVSLANSHVTFVGNSTFYENGHLSFLNESTPCNPIAAVHMKEIKVVVLVDHSTVIVDGSLNVIGNRALSGIMHFSNMSSLEINGNTDFARNNLCTNGVLHLASSNASFTGSFFFQENSAHEYYFHAHALSTSGVAIRSRSFLTVVGNIQFDRNIADVTSLFVTDESAVTINGILLIENQIQGYSGIFVKSGSTLNLFGTGEFRNNKVYNSVIRQEEGSLVTSGNLTFMNNLGNSPCVFRIRSSAQMSGSIMFQNNTGALYLVDSNASFDGTSVFTNNNMQDFAIGGAIAMFRSILSLSGQYLFRGNAVSNVDGGAVYGHISTLIFGGNGTFIGNSARYGGAIYLQNKPLIELKEGATLRFENNMAIKGAAFYIFGSLDSFRCTDSDPFVHMHVNKSPCFISFDGHVNNHSLIFHNNIAKEGASILQLKIVEDFDPMDGSRAHITSCDGCILNLFAQNRSETNSLPLLSSDSFHLCFCERNRPACNMKRLEVGTVRGAEFTISVASVTFEINESHSVRSYFQSLNPNAKRSIVEGNYQHLEESCTDLHYRVHSQADTEDIVLSADESCEVSHAQLTMRVIFHDCPVGFSLASGQCMCDKQIKHLLSNCDVDTGELTKNSENLNTWIRGNNVTKKITYYEYCPFQYCSSSSHSVNPLYPDGQCKNNRTGMVCGKCEEGFSRVLGNSKCKECSNDYLALLVPFALLGILLICFLFLTQLTVGKGTIHGLILYANIVNINRSVFLPERFCPAYTVFISWLNLDFGIETCFYNGMDQLAYTVWQFVFPLYLWLLVAGVIILCRCSIKASKFFGDKNPVAVLATVILLSYTKLLQNVITILSVAHLQYPSTADSTNRTVWYYDANVPYGESMHFILIAVALVVLVLLFLPYTFVLVSDQILQKSAIISAILQRLRLTPFIRTYQAPYKSRSRYWIGLCLLLRCALLITFASVENGNVNLLVTSVLCFLLISIIAMSGGIYYKHRLDVLEVSFILNVGILSVVTYHLKSTSNELTEPAYISVSIAFITFLGIILVRIGQRLIKVSKVKKMVESMEDRMKTTKKEQLIEKDMNEQEQRSSGLPTSQDLVMADDESFKLELREPLLDNSITSSS